MWQKIHEHQTHRERKRNLRRVRMLRGANQPSEPQQNEPRRTRNRPGVSTIHRQSVPLNSTFCSTSFRAKSELFINNEHMFITELRVQSE